MKVNPGAGVSDALEKHLAIDHRNDIGVDIDPNNSVGGSTINLGNSLDAALKSMLGPKIELPGGSESKLQDRGAFTPLDMKSMYDEEQLAPKSPNS